MPHLDDSDRLSFWRRGPQYAVLRRLRLARGGRRDVIHRWALFLALGWVPLVLLAAADRAAGVPTVGYLLDPALHARWLLAAPFLFLSEEQLDATVRRVLRGLKQSPIPAGERRFDVDGAAAAVRRSRAHLSLELGLLVVMWGVAVATAADAAGTPGRAAWWHHWVSLPLYRYALALWIGRWLTWGALVHLLLRRRPWLSGTHPDGRAGLRPLGVPVAAFALGVLGQSCVLATLFWSRTSSRAVVDLSDLGTPLGAFVALAVGLAAVPGLLMFPTLRDVRLEALHRYDLLAWRHQAAFEGRWLVEEPPDPLGHPDISSLADLISSVGSIRRLDMLPLTRIQLTQVVAAVLLPLIPVILRIVPKQEVVAFLLGLV